MFQIEYPSVIKQLFLFQMRLFPDMDADKVYTKGYKQMMANKVTNEYAKILKINSDLSSFCIASPRIMKSQKHDD